MFINQQQKNYRRPLPSLLQLSISRCTHFCPLLSLEEGANSFQSQSSVAACKCLVSSGRVTSKISGWWLHLDPKSLLPKWLRTWFDARIGCSVFPWENMYILPQSWTSIAAWPHPISPFILVRSFPIGVPVPFLLAPALIIIISR